MLLFFRYPRALPTTDIYRPSDWFISHKVRICHASRRPERDRVPPNHKTRESCIVCFVASLCDDMFMYSRRQIFFIKGTRGFSSCSFPDRHSVQKTNDTSTVHTPASHLPYLPPRVCQYAKHQRSKQAGNPQPDRQLTFSPALSWADWCSA